MIIPKYVTIFLIWVPFISDKSHSLSSNNTDLFRFSLYFRKHLYAFDNFGYLMQKILHSLTVETILTVLTAIIPEIYLFLCVEPICLTHWTYFQHLFHVA